MEQRSRLIAKGVYVAGCCTAAAGFVALCSNVHYSSHKDVDQSMAVVGSVLLFASLVVAVWLGNRGKLSASWLTLAYGSWITIFVMCYLANLWLTPPSFWAWGVLAALVSFIWGGLRASFAGRWGAVSCWWLGSFNLALCYSLWTTLR